MLSLERRRGRSPQQQGATTHLRMVGCLEAKVGRFVAQQQHPKDRVCETSTAAKCPTPHPLNHFGMQIKPQKLRASSVVRCWTVTTKTCSILCFVPHVDGSHKSSRLNFDLPSTIVSNLGNLLLHFLILFSHKRSWETRKILYSAILLGQMRGWH